MRSDKRTSAQSERERSARARFWAWLGDSANQKTLRFLGAGFAAAVAALATAGFLKGPDKPAADNQSPGISRSAPAAEPPAARQKATAGDHGVAANVQGDGNSVTIGGKP